MEADRIGFRYAVAAGYDKDQVGIFYEKLLNMEKQAGKGGAGISRSLSDAFSTHPPSEERVRQMKDLAAETVQAKAVINTPAFDKAKIIAAGLGKKP